MALIILMLQVSLSYTYVASRIGAVLILLQREVSQFVCWLNNSVKARRFGPGYSGVLILLG